MFDEATTFGPATFEEPAFEELGTDGGIFDEPGLGPVAFDEPATFHATVLEGPGL